jgi:hypothetical protein
VGAQRESVIFSAGKQVGGAHSASPGFRLATRTASNLLGPIQALAIVSIAKPVAWDSKKLRLNVHFPLESCRIQKSRDFLQLRLNNARTAIFKQQNELQAKLDAIDSELRAIDAYEVAKMANHP